jgi:hypothetical protein
MMSFDQKLKQLDRWFAHEGITDFSADEFMQPRRGDPPESILWHIIPTAKILQEARDALGPIHITNGYRSPDYNESIGGRPMSMHIQMNAADASPVAVSANELYKWLDAHPLANVMGLGRYRNFTHVDTRGILGRPHPSRWDNR